MKLQKHLTFSHCLDLPRTCEEVSGNRSGFYLISPNPDVQPFYAYCNFTKAGQGKQLYW